MIRVDESLETALSPHIFTEGQNKGAEEQKKQGCGDRQTLRLVSAERNAIGPDIIHGTCIADHRLYLFLFPIHRAGKRHAVFHCHGNLLLLSAAPDFARILLLSGGQ